MHRRGNPAHGMVLGGILVLEAGGFPLAIEGLGPKLQPGPFGRCASCSPSTHPKTSGTWISYGSGADAVRLCRMHAWRLHGRGR